MAAAVIVMPLRYRNGAPVYGKALQTVLAAIGPMYLEEPRGVNHLVRTDSGVHTTMWIHEWPRSDAHVGFVGGINIIDDMYTPGHVPPRVDFAVRVHGPNRRWTRAIASRASGAAP